MEIKKLTEKQYRFVSYYIKNGFNAYQAARDAGYSQTYADAQAYNLVNHPSIKEHITHACQQAIKTTAITFEWKLNILREIINRFSNSSSPQDARAAIAAIAELNKMTGDYAPAKKVSLNVDTTRARLDEAKRVYEEY